MVLQRALSYFWQGFNMTKSERTQLETLGNLLHECFVIVSKEMLPSSQLR